MEIANITLSLGKHESPDEGLCVMEAVAYVAGEPHTDMPCCACPVIGAFLRVWNDQLPNNAVRDQLLKPLIPRIIGTRSTPAVEEARGMLCSDWLVREYAPAWMEIVLCLAEFAKRLRALKPVDGKEALYRAAAVITFAAREVEKAKFDRQGPAAWRTEVDATWQAAQDAVRVAMPAYIATRRIASEDMADVAKAAATAAAWINPRDCLPVRLAMRNSALNLVERMLAVKATSPS